MIDLSYLTEEEQEMIMAVLKRDAELKRAEEERVRQLQTLLPDRGKLKYMTGEWFYEAKSQRHLDRIHGSDIIRASMKQRKPMTLLDLTQSWMEKSSTASNGNQDIPPEPLVPKEDPPAEPKEERESDVSPDPQPDRLKLALRSPAKQRHNPFNTVPVELEAPGDTEEQLNGAVEPRETPEGEPSSPSKTHILGLIDLNSEGSSAAQSQHTEFAPIPKKRTIIFGPQDSFLDSDSPFPWWGNWRDSHSRSTPPRGILKRSPTLSSEESGLVRDSVARQPEPSHQGREPGDATLASERTEGGTLADSLGKKLVKLSPMVSPTDSEKAFELQEGRELGDHDLQDLDEGGEPVMLNMGSQESKSRNDHSSSTVLEGGDSSLAVARTLQDNAFSSLLSKEPKPSWAICSELPPSDNTYSYISQPQTSRGLSTWDEVGKGEALKSRWETAMWRRDVGPLQTPVDQHEYHIESRPPQILYLLSRGDEKGEPVHTGMGGQEVLPKLTAQSPEHTEEEGDSIAKVLEWFSRSVNSSNRQDEDVRQKTVEESEGEPGGLEDDVTQKTMTAEDLLAPEVESPKLRRLQLERSSRVEEQDVACREKVEEVQMSPGESSEPIKEESTPEHHPGHSSLNTETAYQPRRRMSSADLKLLNINKERAMDKKEESDKDLMAVPLSAVIKEAEPEIKEKEVRGEKPPQKVANLKSFWERGNGSPKILISRLSIDSRSNQTRKEPENQIDAGRKNSESDVDLYKTGQEILPEPEEERLAPEDEEHEYEKYVSHFKTNKDSRLLPPYAYSKEMSVDAEDVINEVREQSSPPMTREDAPKRVMGNSGEVELPFAPTSLDETPPSFESSSLPLDENEGAGKYTAKCVIIDEEECTLPVEVKGDVQTSPQGEEILPGTVSPSRQIMTEQQSPPAVVRQSPSRPDGSIGKIRHLRSFWESEKSGPKVIVGKPKEEVADAKEKKFLEATPARMNKRLATSEYDLRTIGTEVSVDDDGSDDSSPLMNRPNFTVLSMKERMEKASTGQTPSNSQFKNLRDFWDGAASNQQYPRRHSTDNRPLSPQSSQSKVQESSCMFQQKSKTAETKPYLNPNYYPRLSSKDTEKSHVKPSRAENSLLKTYSIDISSPNRQPKEKENLRSASPLRQQSVRSDGSEPVVSRPAIEAALSHTGQEKTAHLHQPQRSSEQISLNEAKALTTQKDKELHPHTVRRSSLGNMTGSVNPLRRATSMYVVNLSEAELSQTSPEHSRKSKERQQRQASSDRSRKSNEVRHWRAPPEYSRKSSEEQIRRASLDRSRKSDEAQPRRASLDHSKKSSEEKPQQALPEYSRLFREEQPRRSSLDPSRKSNEDKPQRALPEYSRLFSEERPPQASLDPSRKLSEDKPQRALPDYSRKLNEEQPRRASADRSRQLSEEQPRRASLDHSRRSQEAQQRVKQPAYRETPERRPSGALGENETQQTLARSFIPRDYQHYLGLPERAAIAPFQITPVVKKQEASRTPVPQDSELDLSAGFGPVRASTPVASEESQVRKSSVGQRSWQSPRGPDDIEFDSYRSSTPETWSHSGASSACDDEDQNPVRLALKRAALKPSKPSMSSSKSVEDITALPTMPSFPTSSISDSNQMKKMSKSVPSFLQKESDGRDSDSTSGSSIYSGRQMRMGSSFTNLSSSSGMASVSSASGSVMSIYSGDFGSVEVRGTIQFSLNYVQKLKEFHIFVVRCRDLAAVDVGRNRSNPYVKCYLLPDQLKLGKRKTSVKKKTLNPNFNEILRYRIRMETLKTQTLNLSVWHNDTFGRNSFLGEVEVDLSKWDFGNTQMNNFTLKPRTPSGPQPSEFRGEMRLALRFLPQITYSNRTSDTGEVHIWIKDCKDLPIIRGTSVDPFVKCFVLPDTSRKSRQKTRVLKRTTGPAFNHTMVYDGFRTEDLPEACVELTVWDHDRLANHFVGGLRLGLGTGKSYGAAVDWMDSNAAEASLWERMMDSANEWVEDVLPLRMLTMAKNVWK
ncbi:uncharacterized protein LOC118783085 isoform X2 [Megalops cyprinoides]|uniref:uncharacterized protein LOC118783085 isoform X2 n=1 Tax=Megalops cyprinoides TaxID=118141 RepID=UPI0018655A10|nr:uncharacterized protein LOC118783085 isoform X2 [Megalops cyprinoides]